MPTTPRQSVEPGDDGRDRQPRDSDYGRAGRFENNPPALPVQQGDDAAQQSRERQSTQPDIQPRKILRESKKALPNQAKPA
jgi:hypothetical protein